MTKMCGEKIPLIVLEDGILEIKKDELTEIIKNLRSVALKLITGIGIICGIGIIVLICLTI